MKSKTVLHLAANATLKLLPYGKYPVSKVEGNKKSYDNFISNGKSEITDAIVEGEDKNTSIIEGQGGPWWDVIETDEKDNNTSPSSSKTDKRCLLPRIQFFKGKHRFPRKKTAVSAKESNAFFNRKRKPPSGGFHILPKGGTYKYNPYQVTPSPIPISVRRRHYRNRCHPRPDVQKFSLQTKPS